MVAVAVFTDVSQLQRSGLELDGKLRSQDPQNQILTCEAATDRWPTVARTPQA